MKVLFNVEGYEYSFQLCISGVAPLRVPRLCRPLYHSVVKRRLRQYPFPLCQEHILRDYAKAVAEVNTDRVIQSNFWRDHRRDENGTYVDSSDEEETVFEYESDLEVD